MGTSCLDENHGRRRQESLLGPPQVAPSHVTCDALSSPPRSSVQWWWIVGLALSISVSCRSKEQESAIPRVTPTPPTTVPAPSARPSPTVITEPFDPSREQTVEELDEMGRTIDADGDGIPNGYDNCPAVPNPD